MNMSEILNSEASYTNVSKSTSHKGIKKGDPIEVSLLSE